MTAARYGGRLVLRQPPRGHGGFVPVVFVKQGHGARGRGRTLWRTKQKAAMDGRGLAEIRDPGSPLLLALEDGFEVLELLAVRTDLLAEHGVPIRI